MLVELKSELVKKASDIAFVAHQGQVRKYHDTPVPYITHPQRVAARMTELGYGEVVVAAAWLHDVFEDCDEKWRNEVANECGAEVFALVHELTNPSKGLGCKRALRKEIDRFHLMNVSGSAVDIKLADRADNLKEMHAASDDFKALYIQETEALIGALRYRGSALLLADLREALQALKG